jgi:hypothetical protein
MESTTQKSEMLAAWHAQEERGRISSDFTEKVMDIYRQATLSVINLNLLNIKGKSNGFKNRY